MHHANPAAMPPVAAETASCTLALVTNQFDCERIIEFGRAVADVTGSKLNVINIENSHYEPNPLAIEHLFGVSKRNDALMSVLYSGDVLRALLTAMKQYKPVSVVSGLPSSDHSVLHQVWRRFPNINFFTVDMEGQLRQVSAQESNITA